MADPLQTTVQVQDVPEYLRDYRSALLDAAFRTVFNPNTNWFRQQFPRATYTSELPPAGATSGGAAAPDGTAAPGGTTAGGGGDTRTDTTLPSETEKSGIAAALVPKAQRMLGMVWDAKTRTWVPEKYKQVVTSMAQGGEVGRFNNGGDIAAFYENLRKNMPVGLLPESIPAETLQEMLEQYKITGNVTYPGSTNPFGDTRSGGQTSSWNTGTGFSTTPNTYYPAPNFTGLTPPAGTPAVAPAGTPSGTGGYSGTGGISVGPSTGGGRSSGSGGAVVSPGAGGSRVTPSVSTAPQIIPQTVAGTAGTTSATQGAGGYNPAQYATDEQARGLASLLGGTTARTNVSGPVAPPPQNLINLGGQDSLNAGLVQQALGPITVDGATRAKTPSEMTLALSGLRDEVARSGGNTSSIDNLIRQNTAAYAAGANASPVGQAPPSGSATPAPGGLTSVPNPTMSAIDLNRQNMVNILQQINQAQGGATPSSGDVNAKSTGASAAPQSGFTSAAVDKPASGESKSLSIAAPEFDRFAQPDLGGFWAAVNKGTVSTARRNDEEDDFRYEKGYAAGGSLAQFDIGEDGKVKNYRKGGAIRKVDGGGFGPTGTGTGSGTAPAGTGFTGPNILGFGTAQPPSSGGIANFWNAANPDNQVGANIFNAPPVYGGQRIMGFGQDFGQYTPGVGFTSSTMTRDALSGLGNIPSVFGKLVGQGGQEYVGILPNTEFGLGARNLSYAADIAGEAAEAGRGLIGQVPMDQQSYLMRMMPGIQKMGFQAPISVSPLSTPTIQQAIGVNAPDPGSVIQRLGGVNPALIQGPAPASLMPNLQMAAPERVSGQTIDMLSRLGTINPAQVGALPNIERLSMGPISDVLAGTISTEKFGQPQAQEYMSPYQRMVTDVQKEEAIRQANRLRSQRGAQAVRAGAFGGTRQAVEEGVAREALQRQLGDIEATGQQRAFEQAQGQFERDRAASIAAQQQNVQAALNAALANQRTGLTVGQENLQAALAGQQLGSQQALQRAIANQQAAQQAGITQYGTTADILRTQSAQDLQAALANQQAGLTVGQQNLAAGLSRQQLSAQQAMQQALANQQMQQQAGLTGYTTAADIAKQGMQQALQAQLANQQAGLTAGQANLQAALATQQLGTQAGLEAAKASQAGDLATWQMQLDAMKQASAQEQQQRSQDFQNRLAAIQQAQAGAAGLAGLGSTLMQVPGLAQQLELQRLAALQQGGGAVDARTQAALDLAYQDFINQQNFPYQQMNFLQGILSGVPVGMQSEAVQFQKPSAGGLSGLLTAGAGLFSNIYNK